MNTLIENVIADLISTIIFFFIGGTIVWLIVGRKQNKLNEFLGVKKRSNLHVFFSSLPIPPRVIKNKYGCYNEHELVAVGVGEFELIPSIYNEFSRKKLIDSESFIGVQGYFILNRTLSVLRVKPAFRCA